MNSLVPLAASALHLPALVAGASSRSRRLDRRWLWSRVDYSDEPPPLAEAQTAVEQAEAFIAAISAMLARLEA
jgi:hypothetical protein